MGLLDDAIREHLELKRRRGADSAEVARQEQEAFGPPRRGDFEAAGPPAADPAALDEPATFADAPTALHAVDDLPPLPQEHVVQDEPPRPHGDPADDLPRARPAPPAEPAPDPQPPLQDQPPRPHGDVARDLLRDDQTTRPFDPDEVRAALSPAPVEPEPMSDPEPEPQERLREPEPVAGPDEESDADDVLEETPEFLQETPEHDRLWFEQRPPRDFDF